MQPRKFGSQRRNFNIADAEIARRNIEPGQAKRRTDAAQRDQIIVAARVEQGFLGQGAMGYDPQYFARDNCLGTPLLGFCGVFDLFAHRYFESRANKPVNIAIGGVKRDPTHRDVITLVAAAFGQRDAQRSRGFDRIVKKHLVEVAHPKQQQAFGVGPLDFEILFDHWGLFGARKRTPARCLIDLRSLRIGGLNVKVRRHRATLAHRRFVSLVYRHPRESVLSPVRASIPKLHAAHNSWKIW